MAKGTLPVYPLILCLVAFLAQPSRAAVVFQDGFESDSLSAQWSVSTTEDGRVAVNREFSPASGEWHMVLDDSVNDAIYSVAESTLRLDLSNKKNVVLSFKAKSLGNEAHYAQIGGSRLFDGVSVSADGGVTWSHVMSLAFIGTEWEAFSIPLDYFEWSSSGRAFGPGFRIRFSEYDNATAPLDGIAIDDVVVTAEDDLRVVLELPQNLTEGSGPHTGYVLLAYALTNAVRLALSTSPTGQISMPAFVDVPAGQTSASFSFSVLDDEVVNLTRTVDVHVSGSNVTSTSGYIRVFDDDVPAVTLILPNQLAEGVMTNDNARVILDRAPSVPFNIYLTPSPFGQVDVYYYLTVPPGETQTVFTVNAYDDSRIDGTVAVTITATLDGVIIATNQLTTIDNETRALLLALPAAVQEGSVGTGVVRLSGTLSTNFSVSLASSNESALTVPLIVTIVAGQLEAAFPVTAADNAIRDGSGSVTINASASAFASASGIVTIRDNEVAGYRFGSFSNLVDISRPLPVTVSAADIEGNPISGVTATVTLSLVLPGGATLPVTPSTVNLSGVGWTGNVTLPAVESSPLRLRAADAAGNSGDSVPFDIMRMLNLEVAGLAWDAARNRLYASVRADAESTNANRVVAIDPFSAAITGSVFTGQDPGQLILTSGGEHLYVALNGNGTIARINPATLTIASTFAVGTSPSYGTLYAADMCAVAGQPNLLVVSQKRTTVSPQHNGVAVYDNGVARPVKTQDHTGSNLIEPSADPSNFFGYNTESTEYGFRRLRLDASGMTELEVNRDLISGFGIDMRSDGNKVFSTTGVQVDGAQMRRVGVFPVSGPVCPDLAAGRVYFIERQYPDYYYGSYDKIGAYDPTTFSNIRRLTLPAPVESPEDFIRWGTNGLAFFTSSNVVLISSSHLVPSGPPANLVVTVAAAPNPVTVSAPLTYTIGVSNRGPNIAGNTILVATLSDNQTIQSVAASAGTPVTSSNSVTLLAGDLASGALVTLAITTLPESAGSLTCSASASSEAIDPDFTDNSAAKLVSVGFQSAIDTVSQLRLVANNLIYDPNRNLLWATIPGAVPSPLGKSVVSIDPTTGLISAPLPINGNPVAQCMALSGNGRYLYAGLSDSPEVHRIDLASTPISSVRVPLGNSQWGSANYAQDIEPLDGDGTSFLMAGSSDHAAAVYDGLVRRSTRTDIYSVDRVERTAVPGVFVGYNNYTSGYQLSSLAVTASGVSVSRSVGSLISGYYVEIRGAENLVLSSTGLLVDSTNLTLKANLGVYGSPCLDAPNQRAYIVSGNKLRGFDMATSLAVGNFTLPVNVGNNSSQTVTCVRWGLDGFAILGDDGKIYILRWSATIPSSIDSDADGLSDAWEAAYFGALTVDPAADPDGDGFRNFQEYIFGTSPLESSLNPMQVSASNVGGQMVIRLVFPRRAGLARQPYEFVISADLAEWARAEGFSETVLSTQNAGGVQIEIVEALIPSPDPDMGIVRFKWLPQ